MLGTMAALHPIVVHVTIVLLIVGVVFRLLSLVSRLTFAGPAAATLIIVAAITSVPAAQSGIAAHGPVERVPGARPAVEEHEEWGGRTRNILLVLGAIELAALVLRRSPKARMLHVASALVGLVAAFAVYETGKHGGELVYSYAGGVGLRSGDPKDVERLLVAGAYHQAMADRQAGRAAEANELIVFTARRFPSDPEMQLLVAESQLLDLKNAQAAIDALAAVSLPDGNRMLAGRKATLQADAFEAAGQKDQAIAVLEKTMAAFPNPRMQQRLDALKGAR